MSEKQKRDKKYNDKYEKMRKVHIKSEALGVLALLNIHRARDIIITRQVRYSEDDARLYLNIYRKKSQDKNQKRPVFVYIHGGGWMCGKPEHREAITTQIANNGYFVVSLFYGLAPYYTHPEHIENIYKALAWIISQKDNYNIDIDSMFVGGESAGAHLASMVGAISTNQDYNEKFNLAPISRNIKIKGLVLICGVYNLVSVLDLGFKNMDFYVESFCGNPILKLDEQKQREVSPIHFVSKNFPPSFVVLAEHDKLCANSVELMHKFDEQGVKYGSYLGKGFFAVHAFPIAQLPKISREALQKIRQFLSCVQNPPSSN